WGLRAELWIEPAGEGAQQDGHAGAGAGEYPHVSTDQVRFTDTRGATRPLCEVPARAFSEVMRHVDLFVREAGVGSDPAWRDHGEAREPLAYVQSCSFGDLSAAAMLRRQTLER